MFGIKASSYVGGIPFIEWTIENAVRGTDGAGLDPSSNFNSFIGDNGTKLYVASTLNGTNMYNLSTPWDVSTKSSNSDQFWHDTTNAYRPYSVWFSPDGMILFSEHIINIFNTSIVSFDLAVAWDLNSTGLKKTLWIYDYEGTQPRGMCFNEDGTHLFITGTTNDKVHHWTLSTAWDLDTAAFSESSGVIAGNPTGIMVSPSGEKMFVVNQTDDRIIQYSLSTAWDVSTFVSDNIEINPNHLSPTGVFIKPDGSKLYSLEQTSQRITQYDLL